MSESKGYAPSDDRPGDTCVPETGRLDCLDGRYRFICERSHWSMSAEPFVDTCTATPQRAVGDGTVENIGPPCGADIVYRIIDYRGEGG